VSNLLDIEMSGIGADPGGRWCGACAVLALLLGGELVEDPQAVSPDEFLATG
jgi:hypothetical protein